jgi:geranylgeranyl pyrophosphate synthase
MDDDDLRRGLPTTHRKFDEATAILAGDALLSLAFQELTRLERQGVPSRRVVEAVRRLAMASGGEWLAGGQALDLQAEGRPVTQEDVFDIHRRKTAALFGASMALGGLVATGSAERVEALDAAGRQLGLAFQIQDELDLGTGGLAHRGREARTMRAARPRTHARWEPNAPAASRGLISTSRSASSRNTGSTPDRSSA